jgi:cob(I)alamin adenosyltransferase
MTKLFTGKGDDGTTGLLGNERVIKSDMRIETIGTLDELNAFLGNARANIAEVRVKNTLVEIQRDLYKIMTDVAVTKSAEGKFQPFPSSRVSFLEDTIDEISQTTEIPNEFIIPGETRQSALFSICRAVARRAERHLVDLTSRDELKNPEILRYINRLSSLLFLLEIKFSKTGRDKNLRYAKVKS